MSFARVLAESGLTKIELAAVFGVSRQTIYAWGEGNIPRGKHKPRGNVLYSPAKFAAITQALETAIDKRLLPLEAMEQAARRERVEKMAARLQGLKSAPKQ